MRAVLLLAVLLAQALASRPCPAAPGDAFEFDGFALYLPADVPALRGILLALGGPDTRAFISGSAFGAPLPELEASLQVLGQDFRSLADDYGLAILGTSRHGPQALPDEPASDGYIFEAIREAARVSGRRELANAPLFVYGISGGTLQAAGFTARNPERVAALLLKRPGPLEQLSSAEALAVPTYLLLAEDDSFSDYPAVLAVFESSRGAGGLWALAVEPGVPHHSLTPSHRTLTVNWLRAVVERRLPIAVNDPLRAVDESTGWLGDPENGVANWADYPGDRSVASWFPSRATAGEWWKFTGRKDAH